MCSLWYVEALARAGRVDDARLVFENILTYSNSPLGALTSVALKPALWTYSVLFASGSISFCNTPPT